MTFGDKIKDLSTIQLLQMFRDKAGCVHTQHKAELIKEQLRIKLSEKQYLILTIAHSHFIIGEGRKEIDDACSEIIKTIFQL